MPNWIILCNECADEIDEEEIIAILEAKFGPLEDAPDSAVLVCAEWDDAIHPDRGCSPYVCEGEECDLKIVAVDPTSGWFIEKHKEEREEA